MSVRAKKHLGQHFLTDESIAEKIANSLSFNGYKHVLEIGPGMGVLTKYLLKKDIKTHVIEIDPESVDYLKANYLNLASKFHKYSKIVYCSSGAVYGKQPKNIKNIKEDFPFLDIISLDEVKRDYALGKRNAESQIKKIGASGYNVSIARCFAFYG